MRSSPATRRPAAGRLSAALVAPLLSLSLSLPLFLPLSLPLSPALAQEDGGAQEEIVDEEDGAPPPAFEPQLVRLMEILGSVEILRGVCGGETGEWRARAAALIEAEGEEGELRRRMIAGYNRGNRAFAAYRGCTASAVYAIERFMDEGEALSRDLLVRYGE